jgi:3-hydroxybutyryl-CoA dehydratase
MTQVKLIKSFTYYFGKVNKMNTFMFDEIDIGYSASFEVVVTEKMMEHFMEISGDRNPLHTDLDYAKGQGFEQKVVYGMLAASFYSRLVGEYLPGKYCVLESIEILFYNPVFVGDRLTISGQVKNKYSSVHSIEINAKIVNQSGKKTSKANLMTGCLR